MIIKKIRVEIEPRAPFGTNLAELRVEVWTGGDKLIRYMHTVHEDHLTTMFDQVWNHTKLAVRDALMDEERKKHNGN